MQITGSKMIMEIFKQENVKIVFGYPGGAIMNVYDEIYKQDDFLHILTRHEQAAIHAADGYARSSGKVGVAIVTSGPGFTNAVTGLATAYTDSIPLVVISGQVPLNLIGTDGFQEIDAVGISRPCTKHNYLIKNIKDLPRIFKEAFYIAKSGRPGPVLIDLPKDVSIHHDNFIYPDSINLPTYNPQIQGDIKDIQNIVDAIYKSSKPVLYFGGGVARSDAQDEARELVKISQIPCVETLMAKGVINGKEPLNMGMVGMHGTYAGNMALYESDLMVCIGARFDDRVTGKISEFGKFAKIVHIDIDPTSISKIIPADFVAIGDIKAILKELLPKLSDKINTSHYYKWREKLNAYKKQYPLIYQDKDDKNKALKPQWVIEHISNTVGDKANICVDVGQHQMWTAQFYSFSHSKQFISSSGLGTMGFGFPAAMGVAMANPDKISIAISGDGGFMMNIQELMTCVANNIPVVNVIINNAYLGMVRQWQNFFYQKRYSQVNLEAQPDFVKVAQAFGAIGYRVTTKQEFEVALKEAIEKKQVAIIDVVVQREENVLPMMPSGSGLNDLMLLDPNDKDKIIHTIPKD
ncbi:Acetolactate synthase large subunit [hydrothermal vent metagenome]|uniref:acetolactate synthase n=1 Tax=hydrothermal vent metagenome TaxID=652676 RepID=A0A3B1DTW6_9ZZZZ